MRQSKKDRLRAAGWRIGSVKDFLGLSDDEAAVVEMKLSLALSLRQRRTARRWTQGELARRLKSSQSRVAKMEAADSSVSLDLLIRALLALGATRREIARLLGRKMSTPAA